MLIQCGPGSEVVPAKIRGKTEDVPSLFPLRRTGLEHGIIHADVFTFRIQFAECSREPVGAKRGGDLLEQGCGHGQMLLQGVGQGARAPEKHSAVPEIIARVNELIRLRGIGLLGEAAHAQGLALICPSGLDVSIAGFRACGANAEHNNVRARGREFYAALQGFTKTFLIGDDVIRRKQTEHRRGILAQEKKCCQPDGRGCVPGNGLGDQLIFGHAGQLFGNRRP